MRCETAPALGGSSPATKAKEKNRPRLRKAEDAEEEADAHAGTAAPKA